jgi:hypothetical protein
LPINKSSAKLDHDANLTFELEEAWTEDEDDIWNCPEAIEKCKGEAGVEADVEVLGFAHYCSAHTSHSSNVFVPVIEDCYESADTSPPHVTAQHFEYASAGAPAPAGRPRHLNRARTLLDGVTYRSHFRLARARARATFSWDGRMEVCPKFGIKMHLH